MVGRLSDSGFNGKFDVASADSAQGSDICTSGIDVTLAPYGADPTGLLDSSPALNAAIAVAGLGGAGMAMVTVRNIVLSAGAKDECKHYRQYYRD